MRIDPLDIGRVDVSRWAEPIDLSEDRRAYRMPVSIKDIHNDDMITVHFIRAEEPLEM